MEYLITKYSTPTPGAVALEDSIMQKGAPVTAGSKILENFISPFDATVVSRLSENNIGIVGKTTMDEFGIGAIAEDSAEKLSGAVGAVANHLAEFSLCNDVFGKQRRQAAENGMCYIHPTYGTVSRFGLIPLASSMDQIGVVCKNLSDGFGLLSAIAGHDPKDGAMFPEGRYSYAKEGEKIRAGFPTDIISRADKGAQESIRDFAAKFDAVEIGLDYFDVTKQILYILACAEISNNTNRYDGIKFGYRSPRYKSVNDLYVNTRTEAFGLETKLAAVMGSFVLSQEQYIPYYEKAMKIRGLIQRSLQFGQYDVIILPTRISEDPYENLSLFALAPLAGLPSVSFSHQGHGIQMIAGAKNENALLTAWEVSRS